METMKINVLGTEYTITEASEAEDKTLATCDGYCDKTTKRIVVCKKPQDCELGDYRLYQKKVIRHEIVHAFLFESGLHESWKHNEGHDEAYVDWIAVQFPKLLAAIKDADAL